MISWTKTKLIRRKWKLLNLCFKLFYVHPNWILQSVNMEAYFWLRGVLVNRRNSCILMMWVCSIFFLCLSFFRFFFPLISFLHYMFPLLFFFLISKYNSTTHSGLKLWPYPISLFYGRKRHLFGLRLLAPYNIHSAFIKWQAPFSLCNSFSLKLDEYFPCWCKGMNTFHHNNANFLVLPFLNFVRIFLTASIRDFEGVGW